MHHVSPGLKISAALAASFVALDQLTKLIIRSSIPEGASIPLIPGFFSIAHLQNTGAAFSIFQGYTTLLIIVSVVVLFAIIYFYRDLATDRRSLIAASLILGGLVGNLIDRVFLGSVTDFIAFSFWPAFNVADSAATIGVAILILSNLFKPKLLQ